MSDIKEKLVELLSYFEECGWVSRAQTIRGAFDEIDNLRTELAETKERDNDACPIRFNDHPERQWPTTGPCTIPSIDALEDDPEGYGTYAIRKLCEFARDLAAESERRGTELQQHQWRSIESAPRDGTRVLVGRPDEPCKDGSGVIVGGTFEASWDDESQKWLSCVCLNCLDEAEVVGPTHWRPFPAPPEPNQ